MPRIRFNKYYDIKIPSPYELMGIRSRKKHKGRKRKRRRK